MPLRFPMKRFFVLLLFALSVNVSFSQATCNTGACLVAELQGGETDITITGPINDLKNAVVATDGVTIKSDAGGPYTITYAAGGAAHAGWPADLFTVLADNFTMKDLILTIPQEMGAGKISGGVVVGAKASGVNTKNATFENVTFRDCWGPGLYVTSYCGGGTCPTDPDYPSENINYTTENLTITDCNASGCGIVGSVNEPVDNWKEKVYAGIQVGYTRGVTVTGDTITQSSVFEGNSGAGIYFIANVTGADVSGVISKGNGLPGTNNDVDKSLDNGAGISVSAKCFDVSVKESIIENNNVHGIELREKTKKVDIINNAIRLNGKNGNGDQASGVLFQFGGSSENTVVGNKISDNLDAGIYMFKLAGKDEHTDNIFYQNTLERNGGGIVVLSSSGSFIAENVIKSNEAPSGNIRGGENGIYFGDGCDNGVVVGNIIDGATYGYGVLISEKGPGSTPASDYKPSNNVYILDNEIKDASPTGSGIRVENSDDSHIGNADATTAASPTGCPSITRVVDGYGTIKIEPSGVLKNTITGAVKYSIDMENSTGVDINGAYVGTEDGSTGGNNSSHGINLYKCREIEIGVTEKNVISGSSTGYGIYADSCRDITIQQNIIGLKEDGSGALANGLGGVYLGKTIESFVGGSNKGNVISGNSGNAITVTDQAKEVTIQENLIGLAPDGLTGIPNKGNGISVEKGEECYLLENFISGNEGDGIAVSSTSSLKNEIKDNIIGLNIEGDCLPNLGDGLSLTDCAENIIESNVIGCNDDDDINDTDNKGNGISMFGQTDDNVFISNYIGLTKEIQKTISSNAYPETAPSSGVFELEIDIDKDLNRGNLRNGIFIESTADDNKIGQSGSGNFISGNKENGIQINGSSGNFIDGNVIGLNADKSLAIPNGVIVETFPGSGVFTNAFSGVHITGSSAKKNTLGQFARNAIGGQHGQHVLIDDEASENVVQGTDFGFDETLVPNAEALLNAIVINGANDNRVGGTIDPALVNNIVHSKKETVLITGNSSRNIIRANVFTATTVGTDSPESAIKINGSAGATGNIIGGPDADQGNIIMKTTENAITIEGTTAETEVLSNYIGVSYDATLDVYTPANVDDIQNHGIFISGANVTNSKINKNVIGNVAPGFSGVFIENAVGVTEFYGNYIGITPKDDNIANASNGVTVTGSTDVKVGTLLIGTIAQAPNIISNNTGHGVEVINSINTSVENNYIGTNVDGDGAAANSEYGVHISSVANGINSDINTGVHVLGNVISGNAKDGVYSDQNIAGVSTINDNKIGVFANETDKLANVAGNGITITDFTTAGATLTISGNTLGGHNDTYSGVALDGSENVTITGNFVGVSSTDDTKDLGNGSHGISLNDSKSNTISSNRIAFNKNAAAVAQNGINITGAPVAGTVAESNTVDGNTITDQEAGIYLDASKDVIVINNTLGESTRGNVYGIQLKNGSSSNEIGQVALGNTISYNTTMGIQVDGAATLTNTIRANSMFCNTAATTDSTGTGIELANGGNNSYGLVINDPNKVGAPDGVDYTDKDGNTQTAYTLGDYRPALEGTNLSVAGLDDLDGGTVDIYSNDVTCDKCQGFAHEGTSADLIVDGKWEGTVSSDALVYVIIVTDAAGNSTEHSGCSVPVVCEDPYANFVLNTPIFTLSKDVNPEDKGAFCEDDSFEFEINPAQDAANLDVHEFSWYRVTDTTDIATIVADHDTLVTGVPDATIFDVVAGETALTYEAEATGYYIFYINVDGNPACGTMSEIVKVQEHLDPTGAIEGADIVCEDTEEEVYTLEATGDYLTQATKFGLETEALFTVSGTGVSLNDPADGKVTNDYSGTITYGEQKIDFGAVDGTISVVESYKIKSSTLLATEDLTCQNATAFELEVEVQVNPELTNTTLAEAICDEATSAGVELESDVTDATFEWVVTAVNVTGNSVDDDGVELPTETLELVDEKIVGTVSYEILPVVEITPTGLTARKCSDDANKETFVLTVQPLPVEPTPFQDDACVDGVLQLYTYTNTAGIPVADYEYAWDGELSFSSTDQDPKVSDAATVAMSGDYQIVVTAKYGTLSCTSEAELEVEVNELPEPIIEGKLTPCPEEENVEYEVDPSSVDNTFTSVWSHSIEDEAPVSFVPNGNSVEISFDVTGEGDVEVVVTDDVTGCVGEGVLAITVLGNPDVVVTTAPVCEFDSDGNPLSQVFTTTVDPVTGYNYQWYNGASIGTGDPIVGAEDPTYSVVSGVHTDKDIFVTIVPVDCPDQSEVSSNVEELSFYTTPSNVVISGPASVCEGDPVTLTGSYTGSLEGGPTYVWVSPGGTPGNDQATFTTDPAEGGTYTLTVENNPAGCNATATYELEVIVVDVTAVVDQNDVDEGTTIQLSAVPSTYESYSWITSDAVGIGAGSTISDTPLETTTYIVTAMQGTCSDEAEVTVNVRALVAVPSMFTPSNGDNLNDFWILKNIEDYPEAEIKVYNRWGNIVYNGLGGPNYVGSPWDGTKGGNELPAAVYYYVIKLNYKDLTLNGSVTIMR